MPTRACNISSWVKKTNAFQNETIFQSLDSDKALLHTFYKHYNQHMEFEKCELKGLIVLGDSYLSLNPVYGQGMTLAAESCIILDSVLENGGGKNDDFNTKSYYEQLYHVTMIPWLLVVSSDLLFPENQGKNTCSWYQKWLLFFTSKFVHFLFSSCYENYLVMEHLAQVINFQHSNLTPLLVSSFGHLYITVLFLFTKSNLFISRTQKTTF